jgi:hypothetical protein
MYKYITPIQTLFFCVERKIFTNEKDEDDSEEKDSTSDKRLGIKPTLFVMRRLCSTIWKVQSRNPHFKNLRLIFRKKGKYFGFIWLEMISNSPSRSPSYSLESIECKEHAGSSFLTNQSPWLMNEPMRETWAVATKKEFDT